MRSVRYVLSLLIFVMPILSPTHTSANVNLITVEKGTVLQYEIFSSSNLKNDPTEEDFEFYKLLDFDDQLLTPDLITYHIQDDVGFREFYSDPDNSLVFGYSNSYSDKSENRYINPYFPGGIILINDWQYISDFGSVFEYAFQQDEQNKVLTYYAFYDNGWDIEIVMASAEGEFHGTPGNNFTIEALNDYNFRYDKSTGILLDYDHWYTLTNYSQIIEKNANGEIQSSYHVNVLAESYSSKYLYNLEEIFFPITKEKNEIPIEKILAYTLLSVNLGIYVYLTRKKWTESTTSNHGFSRKLLDDLDSSKYN